MRTFITEDFLLQNDVARELYHDHAKHEPILDYHCHLPPQQIAENKTFRNLAEIWLGGDHYKWRALRANGVKESHITGDASDREKFQAWAETVPHTLRNPLYHWTHLELKRYFGIEDLLGPDSAETIWQTANEKLAGPEMSVKRILESQKVVAVCTTDDPADTLEFHQKIRDAGDLNTKVLPTFRPDKALLLNDATAFNEWLEKLGEVSGIPCDTFDDFLAALRQRHDFFHEMGGRLSDHGLETCYADACSEQEAALTFRIARDGHDVGGHELWTFRSFMMLFFGRLDAEKGWTKQLHLGAMRNNNSRLHRQLGPDTGFDSIGDFRQAAPLKGYLDALDRTNELPKTILYNLNPADNYIFATMIGNFQDGSVPGKIQLGSGWWHLDQKEAMEWQLNALSNLGLLSRFVGMLTDSRSFLSYPRHEYFRRILCNLIGRDVENGELPRDIKLLGNLVRDISFRNARTYFGLPLE
jgi:glucuronate isomerase